MPPRQLTPPQPRAAMPPPHLPTPQEKAAVLIRIRTGTATAAAKLHADTGQTGVATDGEGGAARAAAGAEPAAKKKRRRKKKGHNQRNIAQRDKAAAAQGDRSQANTQ